MPVRAGIRIHKERGRCLTFYRSEIDHRFFIGDYGLTRWRSYRELITRAAAAIQYKRCISGYSSIGYDAGAVTVS